MLALASWANAAPRSVVGVIVPPDRDCQRALSTNRRTVGALVHCGKTPVFSVSYARLDRRSLDDLVKRSEKNLVREEPEKRRKGPPEGGSGAPVVQETFSGFGAVLEPQSRGVLV
jgi:hypothetical protein